jgi:hypothetical protein
MILTSSTSNGKWLATLSIMFQVSCHPPPSSNEDVQLSSYVLMLGQLHLDNCELSRPVQ